MKNKLKPPKPDPFLAILVILGLLQLLLVMFSFSSEKIQNYIIPGSILIIVSASGIFILSLRNIYGMTQYEFEKQIIMFLEKVSAIFKIMMRFLIIISLTLLLWFGNDILTEVIQIYDNSEFSSKPSTEIRLSSEIKEDLLKQQSNASFCLTLKCPIEFNSVMQYADIWCEIIDYQELDNDSCREDDGILHFRSDCQYSRSDKLDFKNRLKHYGHWFDAIICKDKISYITANDFSEKYIALT